MEEAPFVSGSPTSEAAAASMAPHAGTVRDDVLKYIKSTGHGATCDEVEAALNLRHQTASARVRELAKTMRIMDSGTTRPTRSGRKAVVWK